MWDSLQQRVRMCRRGAIKGENSLREGGWWRKTGSASPPGLHVRHRMLGRTTQDLQTGQRSALCSCRVKAQLPHGAVPSCPCKCFLSLNIFMTLHTLSPIHCSCSPQPTLSFSSSGELGVFDSNSKSHAFLSQDAGFYSLAGPIVSQTPIK